MKKIIYIVSIITLAFTFNSCESETSILEVADDIGFSGSTEDIESFLGIDVYRAMREAGLIINPGAEPSNLEGTFRANPYCRQESDGSINCGLASWNVTFSNQNNDDLTISYFAQNIVLETGEIIGEESGDGKITGDIDGRFTVLVNAESSSGRSTSTAYSGQIFNEGIYQYQDIYVPDTNASELVTALFFDEDGLAERQ
jgi:hypothetical protein